MVAIGKTRPRRASAERNGGDFAMPERSFRKTRDAKARAAVGIGTRNLGVRRHPVVRMGDPLLRRKQGQESRQRVNGEGLTRRQRKALAAQIEEVAGVVPA